MRATCSRDISAAQSTAKCQKRNCNGFSHTRRSSGERGKTERGRESRQREGAEEERVSISRCIQMQMKR